MKTTEPALETLDSKTVKQKHDYKFERLGEGWLRAKGKVEEEYQNLIHQHAQDGWRLVQLFAPSCGIDGTSKFIEVILEGKTMKQNYEYKFVRLGEGWLAAKREALEEYQNLIHQHAQDGWRLVQVFAPSLGRKGASKFIEDIFEREVPQ